METDELQGVYIWLALWKASRVIEQYAVKAIIEMSGDLDCVSDFAVLEILMHNGPLPVNEIGSRVLLKSASMTVAVDRLEKKGLVERKNHLKDRRARIVHLTADGKKMIKKVWTIHAADIEKLTADLTTAEREKFLKILRQMSGKADALMETLKG